MVRQIIVSATPTLQDKCIVIYFGLVSGEAIMGANIFHGLFAAVRDNTVRYGRRVLQLPAGPERPHYVKARVRVHEYPDGTLAAFHGPRCLARYQSNGDPIETQTRKAA